MESIVRAGAIYAVLLVLFRIAGRRTLADASTFDFALLLIISEAVQQAMMGDDDSLTNAILVISTLILLDVLLAFLMMRFRGLDKAVNGLPLVLVDQGRPLRERMAAARVNEEDVLEAARRLRGLERMDQIKFAILERSGGISVIAFESAGRRKRAAPAR